MKLFKRMVLAVSAAAMILGFGACSQDENSNLAGMLVLQNSNTEKPNNNGKPDKNPGDDNDNDKDDEEKPTVIGNTLKVVKSREFHVNVDSTDDVNTKIIVKYDRTAYGADEEIKVVDAELNIYINDVKTRTYNQINFALDEYGAEFAASRGPISDPKAMKEYKVKLDVGQKVVNGDVVKVEFVKGSSVKVGADADKLSLSDLVFALVDTSEAANWYKELADKEEQYQTICTQDDLEYKEIEEEEQPAGNNLLSNEVVLVWETPAEVAAGKFEDGKAKIVITYVTDGSTDYHKFKIMSGAKELFDGTAEGFTIDLTSTNADDLHGCSFVNEPSETAQIMSYVPTVAEWTQIKASGFKVIGHGAKITSIVANEAEPVANPVVVVKVGNKDVTVARGGKLSDADLVAPEKEGKEFKGWFTDEALTTAFDKDAAITSAMQLYAKYETLKFTVKFETGVETKIDDVVVEYGNKVSVPTVVLSKVNFEFDGWFDGETEYDFDAVVTADKTLSAKWTVIAGITTYTVSFNLPEGVTPITDAVVEENTPVVKPKDPVKDGFRFDGWYTTESFDGDTYNFETAVTGDITLYGKFTELLYTVTFKNGETLIKTVENVKVNTTVAESDIPDLSVEGKVLLGWFNGTEEFTKDTVITDDVVFTACFADIVKTIELPINYWGDPVDNQGLQYHATCEDFTDTRIGAKYTIAMKGTIGTDLEDAYVGISANYKGDTKKVALTKASLREGISVDVEVKEAGSKNLWIFTNVKDLEATTLQLTEFSITLTGEGIDSEGGEEVALFYPSLIDAESADIDGEVTLAWGDSLARMKKSTLSGLKAGDKIYFTVAGSENYKGFRIQNSEWTYNYADKIYNAESNEEKSINEDDKTFYVERATYYFVVTEENITYFSTGEIEFHGEATVKAAVAPVK